MTDIYKYLKDHKIEYIKFEHPAVFTCEQAAKYCQDIPAAAIKNLFLRDDKGKRHFIVIAGDNKNVDLKKLGEVLGVRLSFASPDRLKKYLGVEPGSVSLLGLINDIDHEVEAIIDEQIWGQSLQCHPLVNTATLAITAENITKFLQSTDHQPKIINIPERETS